MHYGDGQSNKVIPVGTPCTPFWKDYKNVWWQIPTSCVVEGCKFLSAVGTNGLCLRHFDKKDKEVSNGR